MAQSYLDQLLRFFAAQPRSTISAACRDDIQLGDEIDTGYGNFELIGQRIAFRGQLSSGSPESHSGVGAIVQLTDTERRYFTGQVGAEFAHGDRQTFLKSIFLAPTSPAPLWLTGPFSFRNRTRVWRIQNLRPVFYVLSAEWRSAYSQLLNAGRRLSNSAGRYFDIVEFDVQDIHTMKRNAGAARILERRDLQVSNSIPPTPGLNFYALAFHEASRDIYFLPDTVVIRTPTKTITIEYRDLNYRVNDTRYITSIVPSGVQPIDFTWQFVNRDGSPDRRFSNNFQVPIIAVTELDFVARSGLQIHFAFTQKSAVESFIEAFSRLQSLNA
ncbi:MAG: hypothetical protein EBX92_08095 [Actinobacteria bacterium]|nr:hypothetical protein [Actinomycetota bacterium]